MSNIDWSKLKTLRQSFLEAQGFLADYWQDEALLAAYEDTLAQRIAWKWDAVLDIVRGQLPSAAATIPHLIDWGCGSGIASRRVMAAGLFPFKRVTLYDRSARATQYARRKLLASHPQLDVEAATRITVPPDDFVLIISHVLSELPDAEREKIVQLGRQAAMVIWVEAGRQQESRLLSEVREQWRPTHQILAPCPHQGPCGMLDRSQEKNWCHFFAPVPREVFHSAFWRECSRELGFDLRSLPLSYLVTARQAKDAVAIVEDGSLLRIIGRSRSYKGHCRWTACETQGILEGDFQKRWSRSLYDQLALPGLQLLLTHQQLQDGK